MAVMRMRAITDREKEQTMISTRRPKLTQFVVLLAIAALATMALASSPGTRAAKTSGATAFTADEAIQQITGADGMLRFEVAEDHTRFAWAGDPELTNGLPAGRTAYIAQGYLYSEGTLNGTNGVKADGSPEFPDKVLGQWLCYGWYLGTDDHVGAAPWVSSHLFNFGAAWGEATLVSEGFDIDDVEVPMTRAIAGGSGPYADARGTQVETNLGLNATDGLNIRFEVNLAKS
jgi:hypothetical protein